MVSEENKVILTSLRSEYSAVIQMWRFIGVSRVVIIATTTTAIGVLMNSFRSGVAAIKAVQSTPLGPIATFDVQAPAYGVAISISLIAIVITFTVIVADTILGRLATRCAIRGMDIEALIGNSQGISRTLFSFDREFRSIFIAGQVILSAVALFWVLAILYGSANTGESL